MYFLWVVCSYGQRYDLTVLNKSVILKNIFPNFALVVKVIAINLWATIIGSVFSNLQLVLVCLRTKANYLRYSYLREVLNPPFKQALTSIQCFVLTISCHLPTKSTSLLKLTFDLDHSRLALCCSLCICLLTYSRTQLNSRR